MKYLTLVVLFLSCATSKMIVGPDGSSHQLVACPSVEYCYEKAREVCGGNYKIINTSTKTDGSGNFTSTETSLLVKCDKNL